MLLVKPSPTTLLALLLDAEQRSALNAAVNAQADVRQAFAEAALHARIDPAPLEAIAFALMAEGADALLDELVLRPDMPTSVLDALCDAGRCISSLGHRAGPRAFLLRLVQQHAYPEAILTVARELLEDPTVPDDVFVRFAQQHQHLSWLLRHLASACASSRVKLQAYRELLVADDDAAAHHTATVVRDPSATESDLSDVLDRLGSTAVLAHLLQLDGIDADKARLIHTRAVQKTELADALLHHHHRTRACANDLDEEESRVLLRTDEPRVLLALAQNPRTARDVVELLSHRRGSALASQIRHHARATLRAL